MRGRIVDNKVMATIGAAIIFLGEMGLAGWALANEHRITTLETVITNQNDEIKELKQLYKERSKTMMEILIELKSRKYERNPMGFDSFGGPDRGVRDRTTR